MRNAQIADRLAALPEKEIELLALARKHTDPATGRINLQELETDPDIEIAAQQAAAYADGARKVLNRLMTRMT